MAATLALLGLGADVRADSPPIESTAHDWSAVVANAPGVPDHSIYAGFENNESVSLYNGNLLVTHASSPVYPLDGGGSFGLSRSYNSQRVRKDRVRFEDQSNGTRVHRNLLAGRSWLGFGWTMHLGRVFRRAEYDPNTLQPSEWANDGRRVYFVDGQGTEHELTRAVEAHPLLRWQLIPEEGHWDPACEGTHTCPAFCATSTRFDYPACENCDCAWIPDTPSRYLVTLEDGTEIELAQRVAELEATDSRGWIQNHDRSGWYATRIEDVHGNGVEIEYWEGTPYPEAIKEIASLRDPGIKVTTTLWEAGDGTDGDLLLDAAGQKIWSPLFVGMVKEVRATGFQGPERSVPQEVVYKFVYGKEPEQDGDATVDVAVLQKVLLPKVNGVSPGAIEYGYRKGYAGAPFDPGFSALLDRILYPLGGASVYGYGGWICGTNQRKDEGTISHRMCFGVEKRLVFPVGLGPAGDGAGQPRSVWRWEREFGIEPPTAGPWCDSTGASVVNRFREITPDGVVTQSEFWGHPCGDMAPVDYEHRSLTGWLKSRKVLAADGTALRTEAFEYDYTTEASAFGVTPIQVLEKTRTTTVAHEGATCFESASSWPKTIVESKENRTAWNEWRVSVTEGPATGHPLLSQRRLTYVHYDEDAPGSPAPAPACRVQKHILSRAAFAFVEGGAAPDGRRYEVQLAHSGDSGTAGCTGQMTQLRALQGWQAAGFAPTGTASPGPTSDRDLVSDLGYSARGNLETANYSGGDLRVGGGRAAYAVNYTWNLGRAVTARISPLAYDSRSIGADVGGQIASSTDPNGFVTSYDFDALGRLTKIDPPGSDEYATRIVYPSLMKTRVIRSPGTEADYQATDSQQEFSEESYDGLGRVIERRRAMPQPNEVALQVIRYDTRGREIFVSEWMKESEYTAATKATWDWDNDGAGDNGYSVSGIPLVGGIGSRPRGTLTFYGVPNGAGTNPLDVTPDPLGRARRIELADGAVTTKQYCGPHEQTRVYGVDANGDGTASATEYVTTRFYRDGLGRLAMVDTDAEAPGSAGAGADAVYRYDPRGKLEKVTLVSQLPSDPFGSWVNPSWAPAGQTRTFEHDALGRLRESFNPEKGSESFARYDVWGNLLAWQDQKGLTQGYFFEALHDAAGRPTVTRGRLGTPDAPEPVGATLIGGDSRHFDGSLGAWIEGTIDASNNFSPAATAWEQAAYGSCSTLPAPPSEGGSGALRLGSGCTYSSAENRWEVVRLAISDVSRLDSLAFKYWRRVRETSAGGDHDAFEVWVTRQSDTPQFPNRRVLFRLDEEQVSFGQWLRSPSIRLADAFSETEWTGTQAIYLWFAFNKGDNASSGLGEGIAIDDVTLGRDPLDPMSETVWDHDACGGASFQATYACSGGEESNNAYLGRVGRVLSYEDGRLVGERRFVYKGMNGRLSGVRQRLDWRGFASPNLDAEWADFIFRQAWSAGGQVASLDAPYRSLTEERSYSYQRRRSSLIGIADADGPDFLASLDGHAPIEYDTASQPTWIGLANGTSMAIPRDVLHRPQSMTVSAEVAGGSLAPWQSGDYAFDGAGNITEIGSQRFNYDAAFRLVRAKVLPQAQAPAEGTPDQLSWVYDLAGNMLSQTLVSTTQVPEPPGHDFAHTFPQALENNDNRMTDAAFSYDPNGNLVRFKGQQQQSVGARWDASNRMQAFVEGDPWTSAGVPGEWYRYDASGQRWFRMGRDGKVVLTLRDEDGQALSEFVETPTSGGPALKADFVYGLGKLLVERKVGVAPPEMAANSPLTSGTNERFVVTSGAGVGSYTVDIAAPSGYRNRVTGVTLDAQGRFTLPESAFSPQESNRVRIRKDGQVGSGYSAPVSLAYDPTVTGTSPNPVRALAIHWASNNLVVRWSLAQDTGKAQRLFFRSSDGLTTVLLTPTALPSSVLSYTLASQALSAPCGALYLETLEAAASPMAGLPSAEAGEQGIGMNPCPGGAPDPPDPPAGPAFVNWYHHRDHLGTLRNVTDEAGYVVVGYDDYPYGARMPQSATAPAGGSTRQFTGHERDAATGLDYMGARFHSPNSGQLLSADPRGGLPDFPQSWNSYAYALDNPVALLDPSGATVRVATDLQPFVADAMAKSAEFRDWYQLADENPDINVSLVREQQGTRLDSNLRAQGDLTLSALPAGIGNGVSGSLVLAWNLVPDVIKQVIAHELAHAVRLAVGVDPWDEEKDGSGWGDEWNKEIEGKVKNQITEANRRAREERREERKKARAAARAARQQTGSNSAASSPAPQKSGGDSSSQPEKPQALYWSAGYIACESVGQMLRILWGH